MAWHDMINEDVLADSLFQLGVLGHGLLSPEEDVAHDALEQRDVVLQELGFVLPNVTMRSAHERPRIFEFRRESTGTCCIQNPNRVKPWP